MPPIGELVNRGFNLSPQVGMYTDFYAVVHNAGDAEGEVFAVIRNQAGNPGDVMVIWQGQEWTLPPDTPIALRPDAPVTVCSNFRAEGQIKYTVEGSYTLNVEAGHVDATGLDVIDETVTLDITATLQPKIPWMPILAVGAVTLLYLIIKK